MDTPQSGANIPSHTIKCLLTLIKIKFPLNDPCDQKRKGAPKSALLVEDGSELEHELARKLELTIYSRVGALVLVDLRVGRVGHVVRAAQIQVTIGMVEDVVGLTPELEAHALVDLYALVYVHVKGELARSAEGISRRQIGRASCRERV